MERCAFWEHDRRNLQADPLNQLTRFGIEDRAARRTGHEHHESWLAARLSEFGRGPDGIKIEGTRAAGNEQ
jgi:hypothetical protein